MLGAGDFGMALTESFAMMPASSGPGCSSPTPAPGTSRVGRIGRDQAQDYAVRRGVPLEQAEHWLAPNLAYEPGRESLAGRWDGGAPGYSRTGVR